MGRQAARIDENQPEIVNALRKAGASVQTLAGVGMGCPDLLVGFRGQNFLIEVKNPAKPPSGQKLTVWQEPWHKAWSGQVSIAKTTSDAFTIIGLTQGTRDVPVIGDIS